MSWQFPPCLARKEEGEAMAFHDINRYSMVLNANVTGDGITQATQGQQANNLALAQKTQTAIRKW